MSHFHRTFAAAAFLLAATAQMPALAASSAASSASEAGSSASGSSSTSLETSSDSSKTDKKVAAGDYIVIAMAELADKPGMMRVHLRAQGGEEFFLRLPRQAAEVGHLSTGKTITAQHRPYGIEFAAADTKTAFFLVLDDAWQRELQSRPVLL